MGGRDAPLTMLKTPSGTPASLSSSATLHAKRAHSCASAARRWRRRAHPPTHGEGHFLRRLQDHAVAARDGDGHGPHGHHHREVERHNLVRALSRPPRSAARYGATGECAAVATGAPHRRDNTERLPHVAAGDASADLCSRVSQHRTAMLAHLQEAANDELRHGQRVLDRLVALRCHGEASARDVP
jgi:hypothetical protein